MSKRNGSMNYFSYLKEYDVLFVIGYDLVKVDEEMYSWYELSFFKDKYKTTPSLDVIKEAIISDIDSRTDETILNGYQWTVLHGADAGKVANVWLTMENQQNYKAYHDTAKDYPQFTTYPIKYKVGENPDKTPIYEEFANFEELAQFYLGGVNFIKQTVEEGWVKKDSIDWSKYVPKEPEQESEIVD